MARLTRKDLAKLHEDAVRKQYPLIRQVKPGKLVLCASCDRIHIDGVWKQIGFEDALARTLSHSLKQPPGSLISSVEFSEPDILRKPGVKRTAPVLAIVTGRNEEVRDEYTEEYEVPLNYEVTICEFCKKKSPTYHQGILQVRHENEFSKAFVSAYLEDRKERGTHLTKRVERPGGTDYFLSDHRAIGHLARKLNKEFGGELKVNAQHFSEDKQAGKILYRTNALVVLPEYTKGSAIRKDGIIYVVLGIGNKVKAENLLTGRTETFKYHRGDAEVLPQVTTSVVRTDPIEVLHPETYQPIEPLFSKYAPIELYEGEEVKVVVAEGKVFLVPQAA